VPTRTEGEAGVAGVRPRTGGRFGLSFDDGPDPLDTPRVLDALKDADAPGAFFPIAAKVEQEPELTARMVREGHEVHLHCYDHAGHAEAGRAAVERDTELALVVLSDLGIAPRFWRPPWGLVQPWTSAIAAAHGLELTGWSVDTHDWRGDSARAMLRRTTPLLVHGAFVLMHDGLGPGALRRACRATAELVAPLVDSARARGLEPGTLESLGRSPSLDANLVTAIDQRSTTAVATGAVT